MRGIALVVWVALSAGQALALPEDLKGSAGLLPEPAAAPTLSTRAPTAEEAERYHAAAAYSDAHRGRALLIVDGSDIVFEHYVPGFARDRAHHIWSGTKTFACALVAAAEVDGRFGFDTPLGAFFPELDAARRALTVHDLLSLTSGLDESGPILTSDLLRATPKVADKEAWTFRHMRQVKPTGARFRYAASPFVFVTALAKKALGEDPVAYLERRIFEPLGLRQSGWVRDGAGHPWFSFGAYVTARGWARLGMLLRDDGRFLGRRILPPGHLARCLQGTPTMPAYGLGLWRNAASPHAAWIPKVLQARFSRTGAVLLPGGPSDLHAAVGYGDNRLYWIPSRGLVIVRFGVSARGFTDAEFLTKILQP